jgi:hypothetical protein
LQIVLCVGSDRIVSRAPIWTYPIKALVVFIFQPLTLVFANLSIDVRVIGPILEDDSQVFPHSIAISHIVCHQRKCERVALRAELKRPVWHFVFKRGRRAHIIWIVVKLVELIGGHNDKHRQDEKRAEATAERLERVLSFKRETDRLAEGVLAFH